MEKIEKIIEKTPLKDFISQEYLKKLKLLNLSSGEYIHCLNKETDTIFFVMDGVIQIKQVTEDGTDFNYSLLSGFNVFGERRLLFHDEGELNFNVVKDNTKIIEIPLEIGKELIKNDRFKMFLLKLHCEKLHKLVENISILHFKGVNKFLAHSILTYSKEEKIRFKNMSFLSDLLSIDRKSLYSAVKKLEEEKLIAREDKVFKVLDRERLKEYARY